MLLTSPSLCHKLSHLFGPPPLERDVLYGRPLARNELCRREHRYVAGPARYQNGPLVRKFVGREVITIGIARFVGREVITNRFARCSFIHSGNLWSTSSKKNYSETLPVKPRPRRNDLLMCRYRTVYSGAAIIVALA